MPFLFPAWSLCNSLCNCCFPLSFMHNLLCPNIFVTVDISKLSHLVALGPWCCCELPLVTTASKVHSSLTCSSWVPTLAKFRKSRYMLHLSKFYSNDNYTVLGLTSLPQHPRPKTKQNPTNKHTKRADDYFYLRRTWIKHIFNHWQGQESHTRLSGYQNSLDFFLFIQYWYLCNIATFSSFYLEEKWKAVRKHTFLPGCTGLSKKLNFRLWKVLLIHSY